MWNCSAASARYAFIDVETTGFSPQNDAVVEVACQIVEDGNVVDAFETLIDPQIPIPLYATRVHGITDDCVAAKPRLWEVREYLDLLCSDAIIVAHNARFDLSFLPFLAGLPSLCSWRFAERVVPFAPNYKNQTLRAYFGVTDPDLEGRTAHRAMSDVIVTRHVFFRCLDRYKALGEPDDIAALLRFMHSPANAWARTKRVA